MQGREPIQQLVKKFEADISNRQLINGNEWYLETNPTRIAEICGYVHRKLGYPLIALFAADERSRTGNYTAYYVFGEREAGRLLVLKIPVAPEKPELPSITCQIPAAALYEREIHDLFGIVPAGHPDLRRLVLHRNWPQGEYPLRKDFAGHSRPPMAAEEISFNTVMGEGVYEIPVGPVHAGIIEPGHFRFSVAGEPIINLEAQLYFVHKGIEKLAEGKGIEFGLYLAERISGDETIANALAYCQAVEKIGAVAVPERAQYIRVVFAELERLTSHLGDLAGVCLDVAYGFAAFQFRMLRGWAYQLADQLCGMRFLRSVIQPGGVRKDFVTGKEQILLELLARIQAELTDTVGIIKSNSLFIDRIENTGVLPRQIAVDLNAVGPAGRAAGICSDIRKAFPYAAYDRLSVAVPHHHNGDVNCRINTKIEECFESIRLISQAVREMPGGEVRASVPPLPPGRWAFGLNEAPRGENLHWLLTGESNTIFRYKVRTPSFCNWPALCHAVRGNIVPDFPLINKSFNLSYAGNDL